MQISDIHVSEGYGNQFIIESFVKASTLHPDIVVYTGDYVNEGSNAELKELEKVLKYRVKGKLATIAVMGNHDYGHKWQDKEVGKKVFQSLTTNGITVLRNEFIDVCGLKIIGLDDYWGPYFNPSDVFKKHGQKADLVLCHNPDVCDLDIWNSFQGWILSGHTHGGQCKPPFLPPPILPVKNKMYTQGKFEFQDGRKLYITRGLGQGRQVRFNVRPEITIFELEGKI